MVISTTRWHLWYMQLMRRRTDELVVEGGKEGGLLAYPSSGSSEGRWVGRRAERRRWTWCPLAACGAFHSPPPTETESSSETEGNWCLRMRNRWISKRRTAKLEREEAKLALVFFCLFVRRHSWFQTTSRWKQCQQIGGKTWLSKKMETM